MSIETGNENNRLYEFGRFRVDAAERRLTGDGDVVPLPTKVFDLLLILIRAAGHLKTREELIEALWPDTIVEEHGLTSRISALRKALGDEGEVARYIETVRGHGYRFIAPVRVEPSKPAAAGAGSGRRRMMIAIAAGIAALLIGGAGVWWLWSARPAAGGHEIPARSIAVLPFENLSTDPANAYFASGIQDMILTKLAGITDLRVISRTSTEHYASRPSDLGEVARQFGVASVLEGSVQKAGGQVLINVQLIDARTDVHLWAHSYTRSLDHVFDVEADVAGQVAAALKANLLHGEAERLARAPTRDSRAYDLFLQAEYSARRVEEGGTNASAEAYERATNLYRDALAEDPGFALAEARYSFLQSYAAWFGLDPSPPERRASAERAAEHALKSDLPEAHLAMGYVHYWGHRDYARALEEFAEARRGLPNDSAVIGAIAFIHRRQGKWDEALKGLEQAEILDPRNPLWFSERGSTFAQLRRYAEAETEFDRALAVDPGSYRPVVYKAMTYLVAGDARNARRTLSQVPGGGDSSGVVASVRFRLGWLDRDADQALAALPDADATWIEDPFLATMPASLLRAQAWALKGDSMRARREFEAALQLINGELRSAPDNFNLLSALAATEAGLGQKAAAIRAAQKAVALMPVDRDAIRGTSHLLTLAQTYARFGEAARAVEILHRLLDMPAGMFVSTALLEHDPGWDPIRADPGFRALVHEHATEAPASSVASALH